MKNNKRNFVAGALAGAMVFSAGFAVPQIATAQQQPPTNGWYKVCSKQEENDICNVTFQSIAQNGQLLTAISLLQVRGKINSQKFQATVPPGRLIPPGIKVKIGDGQDLSLTYLVCFPQRCVAEGELTQSIVDSLKGGAEMTVTSVNFQNRPNPIKITLEGFTAAYDGAPLKQDELEARQRQLQEELRAKAEEQRRKLQEAQAKAKEATE